MRRNLFIALVLCLYVFSAAAVDAELADHSGPVQTGGQDSTLDVSAQALRWLQGQQVAPEVLREAASLWKNAPNTQGAELLDRLMRTLALGDENIAELVADCRELPRGVVLQQRPVLAEKHLPPLVRHNLQLVYGQWLVRHRYYDEALEQLADLTPGQVVHPAALLFHQSVVHHRLLHKTKGLEAARALLDEVEDCPARYRAVAMLLEHDLQQLQDESLDHIARRMEDIGRHLDLGRAGPRVRKLEDSTLR